MQIGAKTIEFALDYGVQKISLYRHKFQKNSFTFFFIRKSAKQIQI
jgi:hypothetical protein